MWIQVRTMDGRETHRVDSLSKLTKVDELRLKISELFKVEPERQRLFYRGKQMEDGHTIFDYNVGLNDIVQLLVRQKMSAVDVVKKGQTASTSSQTNTPELVDPGFGLYKINELVDARDLNMGAWFEAQIVNVTKTTKTPKEEAAEEVSAEEILYHVKYEDYPENGVIQLLGKDVRPRARTVYQWHQLEPEMVIMVNYNPDDPKERGYWYDAVIEKKRETRTVREIYAKIILGDAGDSINDCRIMFLTEIYKIEEPGSPGDAPAGSERSNGPECKHCKDDPKKNCQWCNCHICGIKQDPDKQLLCDECDMAFHTYCLNPPLTTIPEDEDWYCPGCRNDASEVVLAGEKLKESKKKSKMASASSSSQRDWGKGMACVGRTKQCTIVPSNHYGPIPGVPVGSMWKFRVQVSESGVHRPHVAGIHGRSNDGAYSLVLAGGYEDDVFESVILFNFRMMVMNSLTLALGDEICLETRGLLSNRPSTPHVMMNNAVAFGHHVLLRFALSCGLLQVVKYWPAKGKSGFLVWRYLLRRDDDEPAPWTRDGKERIKKLGLTIQVAMSFQNTLYWRAFIVCKKSKVKLEVYKLTQEQKSLIKNDKQNKKVWDEAMESLSLGPKFLNKVEEIFHCICCQEVVYQPVTTECQHNVCRECLQRSFRADVYTCPACRHDMGKNYPMTVNKSLQDILNQFFPGYSSGR
uniref:E3 ubiquitin-protein ligase UHRF n=1 Tax=Gasterosteus aculeatus aculeatus TaxID=481459 RepID=A0AAQ4RXE9_GASAC